MPIQSSWLYTVLDTGSGKHRHIVNIKVSDLADSLGEYPCVTLLGYCIFGEEDCTSSFKGKGKVRPPKKLEKNPRFYNAFRQIGYKWKVKHRVMKQLEQFEYLVYGHISKSFVNAVQHVNHLVALYKWAYQPVRGATGVDEDWPGSPGTTVIMWSRPANLAGWSPRCWRSGSRWPGWS